MTQMTQGDISRIVTESLSRHQREGWVIEVLADLIRREDEWWYVPVRPGNEARRTIQYYDILSEVEAELQDEEQLNVLLVPTAPDE